MPEWVVFWSLLAASVGVSVGLAWDGSRAAHRFGGSSSAKPKYRRRFRASWNSALRCFYKRGGLRLHPIRVA